MVAFQQFTYKHGQRCTNGYAVRCSGSAPATSPPSTLGVTSAAWPPILFFAFLSVSVSRGQAIDAEAYIKQNGYKKRAAAGFGVFYTTLKKVKADEMPPFMEAVTSLPPLKQP